MNRVAIYLRLSKEDEYCRDESNSISNQRSLILRYIKKDKSLRKMEVVEIKDDGYSGKNLERPGMQQLLDLIKTQQVSCVIVKDFSRFSRDYLTLGKYTEQIFPFMNIRFIAINDNYDSNHYEGGIGEIDVAFKGLLYDFYSEDLSQKVKTSLKVKRESGKYISTFAPYGYRKDKKDKYKLVVDPIAAKVVQHIYNAYDKGTSMYKIAQGLNQRGEPSPSAYIARRDGKNYFRFNPEETSWNVTAVSRILKNEVYIGVHVYGKSESKEVAAKHGEAVRPENWKRMEQVHPVIIQPEQFNRIRKKWEKNSSLKQVHESHYLKGIIYCGGCGHAMVHSYQGHPKYVCNQMYLDKTLKDCISSIRDEDLEGIVMKLLQEEIKEQLDSMSIMKKQAEKQEEQVQSAKKKLSAMANTKRNIESDLLQSYESYKDGIIEKETYLQQKELYEEMLEKIQENERKQTEAIRELENQDNVPKGWMQNGSSIQIEKLNAELVALLIEKVVVYKDKTIEITWKFHK